MISGIDKTELVASYDDRVRRTPTSSPAVPAEVTPRVTAREQREKQQIFLEGARYGRDYTRNSSYGRSTPKVRAEMLYPIPTRTEPRELQIDDLTFKVLDGQLYCSAAGMDYFRVTVVRTEHITQITELFNNPTITMEVEG